MSGWEYKVVPAPKKGTKGAGVKGPEGRFANAIETLMNDMGAQGWEYQRAETLPSTERSGLTGSVTEWRNVLVFRRALETPMDTFEPELLPPPVAQDTVTQAEQDSAPSQDIPAAEAPDTEATTDASEPPSDADPEPAEQSGSDSEETSDTSQNDNGVEDVSDVDDMGASLKNLATQRNTVKSED